MDFEIFSSHSYSGIKSLNFLEEDLNRITVESKDKNILGFDDKNISKCLSKDLLDSINNSFEETNHIHEEDSLSLNDFLMQNSQSLIQSLESNNENFVMNEELKAEPVNKNKKHTHEHFKRRDQRTSSLFAKKAHCFASAKNMMVDTQLVFEEKKVKCNTVKENKDIVKIVLSKCTHYKTSSLNKESTSSNVINIGNIDDNDNENEIFSEFFIQSKDNEKCAKPMPAIRPGDWTCRRCKKSQLCI